MKEYRLAEGEAKFAKLIWQKEPISSPELVKLCEKEFGWKKYKSRKFVEESFGGSIPKFLTAFMGGKKLSADQAEEIKELIDRFAQDKGV